MTPTVPRVSVIIPTYNQADLLQAALQSVVHQSFRDWEAIVIDNNSGDRTKEVVESFGDRRIRYAAFSNNGVIAASRNHGIRMATGSVIAFLDSDDLWYPSKLSDCLGCIDRGAGAVCHGLRIRKDGLLSTAIVPAVQPVQVYETLLYRGNSGIATSAVMIRKECLNRFGGFSEDPSMVTAEDYELWLRLSEQGIRWGFLPDILGEYTVHSKNASSNVKRQMLAEENVVKYYCGKRGTPHFRDRISCRRRRMMLVFRAGVRVWQSGHPPEALTYFLAGISRIVG